MQWPSQLLDLFDVLSLFNLNIDLLSIDCFVEWTWVRKFILANLIPLVLGAFFLFRVSLKLFHNKFFLPRVYRPAALWLSRAFGMHAIAEEITLASHSGMSPFASLSMTERQSAPEKENLSTPVTPFPFSETTYSNHDLENGEDGDDRGANQADVMRLAGDHVGGGGVIPNAVKRERSRRFASLVSHVSNPSRLIRARLSRAASSLLSEVDEDESLVFARRMQSAFLLFLSWAYMALAQINVEYYTCSATSDGRYVLDMDPTVQCGVGWHQALLLPAIAGTIVYVIGIPLFFALTLLQHRRLLSVRDLIDDKHPSFGDLEAAEQRFGFLFRRYEAEYHWWELMFFFRKLALVSTQAFFSRPLDQCLLTMLALMPGMLGVVRAKPYDSDALDVMEWQGRRFEYL